MKKILSIGGISVIAILALLFALGKEPAAQAEPRSGELAGANATGAVPLAEPLSLAALQIDAPRTGSEPNATRALAEKIAKELLAKNPDGPSLLDDASGLSAITADAPETLIDDILSREIENADYAAFNPTVRTTELNIVAETAETNRAFAEAFATAFNPFLAAAIPTDIQSPDIFAPLAATARKVVRDLRAVPVPAPHASVLGRTIELLLSHEAIFSALASADADPLRAFLAVQLWPEKKRLIEGHYTREIKPLLARYGTAQ